MPHLCKLSWCEVGQGSEQSVLVADVSDHCRGYGSDDFKGFFSQLVLL